MHLQSQSSPNSFRIKYNFTSQYLIDEHSVFSFSNFVLCLVSLKTYDSHNLSIKSFHNCFFQRHFIHHSPVNFSISEIITFWRLCVVWKIFLNLLSSLFKKSTTVFWNEWSILFLSFHSFLQILVNKHTATLFELRQFVFKRKYQLSIIVRK